MEIKAKLNYLRIAPRKVRLVADLIRGKSVTEAERMLHFARKRASLPLLKLLKSAVANARHNFNVTAAETLRVRSITVNTGPTLKRIRPGAQRRTFPIRKRTSHVWLVLEALGPAGPKGAEGAGPAYEVLADEGPKPVEVGEKRPAVRREHYRGRPMVETKPGFVRRIFRRKAI